MLSKHELRFHLAISYSKDNKLQQIIFIEKHFIYSMVLIIKFTITEQRKISY